MQLASEYVTLSEAPKAAAGLLAHLWLIYDVIQYYGMAPPRWLRYCTLFSINPVKGITVDLFHLPQ